MKENNRQRKTQCFCSLHFFWGYLTNLMSWETQTAFEPLFVERRADGAGEEHIHTLNPMALEPRNEHSPVLIGQICS